MVQINFAQREINCKIVYYGPGLSGKTTTLEVIHQKAPKDNIGEMVSIATESDRTLYFDFLPLNLGTVAGMTTKFQIYTVPGQVYYNATRKLVLKFTDGVIFVADSQKDKMEENKESLANLAENLKVHGLDIDTIPLVLQYNKRDLDNICTVEELDAQLNPRTVPAFESIASTGQGVFPALKALSKLVINKLNKEHASVRRGTAIPKPQAAAPPKQPGPPGGGPSAPVAPKAPAPPGPSGMPKPPGPPGGGPSAPVPPKAPSPPGPSGIPKPPGPFGGGPSAPVAPKAPSPPGPSGMPKPPGPFGGGPSAPVPPKAPSPPGPSGIPKPPGSFGGGPSGPVPPSPPGGAGGIAHGIPGPPEGTKPTGDIPVQKSTSAAASTPSSQPGQILQQEDKVVVDGGGGLKKWLVIAVILILVLAAGVFAVYKIKPGILPGVIKEKLDSLIGSGDDASSEADASGKEADKPEQDAAD